MEIGGMFTPIQEFNRNKRIYYSMDNMFAAAMITITFEEFAEGICVRKVTENQILYNIPDKLMSSFSIKYDINEHNDFVITDLDLSFVRVKGKTNEEVKDYLMSRIKRDIVEANI